MAPKTLLSTVVAIIAIISSLFVYLKPPITTRLSVLGFLRPSSSITNIHGLIRPEPIPGTLFSEDIHYHTSSGLIFGVAESSPSSRSDWFPPIAAFSSPSKITQGKIFIIDPTTNTKTDLVLEDFPSAFVTHGIDIYTPPTDPENVYIFAINHLPNPSYTSNLTHGTNSNIPAAASQIELFVHTLGTSSARHLRSIAHPLIRTPNDIYALNQNEIYVTNDHHYRSGHLRSAEDILTNARWSDVIHVSLTSHNVVAATASLSATVALDHIQNPNGFGHGASSSEILLGRAAAGVLEFVRRKTGDSGEGMELEIVETVQLPMTIDNPTYFHDPYAHETGRDASGYLLACLAKAQFFPHAERFPSAVWWVSAGREVGSACGTDLEDEESEGEKEGKEKGEGQKAEREMKLIFQDDGHLMSTASTAVIVAIDPRKNDGKKEGWLFVTGPLGQGVVRLKIDL